MLAYSVFDHALIRSDDKCPTRCKEKETGGLECLDSGIRKTPVKIIDQDDQLIDVGCLEQFVERFPKPINLIRDVRSFRFVFDEVLAALDHDLKIFFVEGLRIRDCFLKGS